MFGESESESPPVPSPWDSLISLSTSPARSATPGTPPSVPKLVPEAEEGNVEYKLQLLSPSTARFARLVTQMKWRLLEGGGQAYYELGVADSGALVGLPRHELEQSLETLEMMAGEIGASVIVVKEIEVPVAISGLAAEDNDKWNRKRRWKKACISGEDAEEEDSSATTENSTTTESESDALLDDSPPVFSLEDPSDDFIPPMTLDRPRGPSFSVDLEISSVFKPRPFRTRFSSRDGSGSQSPATDEGFMNNRDKRREKKQKSKHFMQSIVPAFDEPSNPAQTSYGNRRLSRRMARDRRRDEKRQALLAYADKSLASLEQEQKLPNGVVNAVGIPPTPTPPVPVDRTIASQPVTNDMTRELVAGLETLHVGAEPLVSPSTSPTDFVHVSPPSRAEVPDTSQDTDEPTEGDSDLFPSPTPFSSALSNSIITIKGDSNGHGTGNFANPMDSINLQNQPQVRMIVEALVVRKMSLEEGFLDFEGFQLI